LLDLEAEVEAEVETPEIFASRKKIKPSPHKTEPEPESEPESESEPPLHQKLTAQYYLEAHAQEMITFRRQDDKYYMDRLGYITIHARYVLIEWLFSVHHLMELPRFAMGRIVHVLDCYLRINCSSTTPLAKLQLIGIACLAVS